MELEFSGTDFAFLNCASPAAKATASTSMAT
jgi:hypothetical protein